MICKVAESQVLRMAYQGIFAGTYEESEKWEIAETINDNVSRETVENEIPPLPPFTYDLELLINSIKNGKSKWSEYEKKYTYTNEQLLKIEKVLEELKNVS
jgi:hypothetical protein